MNLPATFSTLRGKLLAVFAALALAPALVLSVVSYRGGVGAVERLLREETAGRAARVARRAENLLRARESKLAALAASPAVRDYLSAASAAEGVPPPPPGEVRDAAREFFSGDREYLGSLTGHDARGRPVFRVTDGGGAGVGPNVQTEAFVTDEVQRFDRRALEATGAAPLRSTVAQESSGACVHATAPVLGPGGAKAVGALTADLRLTALLKEADGDGPPEGGAAPPPPSRAVIALDNATGRIVYDTGGSLLNQLVEDALPSFGGVARRMRAGEGGSDFYRAADGGTWLASFVPLAGLDASVAAAADYGAAASGVRGPLLAASALVALAGAAALVLLAGIARRAVSRIERVAAGAAAIAGGDLDRRIDVTYSGDEAQALVESFNRMRDRLSEQIAREAESKQFESFMRLSAMLTHDLKNAISSLSLLVGNMERQFESEEFRADAVWSLREATDKLRRIVSRLSEPVKSLSGEYRRDARPTDLVELIRRVLARTAEPSGSLYRVEARLPERLVATVEPERIENVVENLVLNAMDAMGAKGGVLTVEAGEEQEGRVFFSVADTGTGMSEEFLQFRLYRPFSTTKQKGIGLGLFTCREVVEAHGGRLEVQSEVGAGTRFRVVIPSSLFASRDRSRRSSRGETAANSG